MGAKRLDSLFMVDIVYKVIFLYIMGLVDMLINIGCKGVVGGRMDSGQTKVRPGMHKV